MKSLQGRLQRSSSRHSGGALHLAPFLFFAFLVASAAAARAMGSATMPDVVSCIATAESVNKEANAAFLTNLYDSAAAKYLEASNMLLEYAEQGRAEVVPHFCKILSNRAAALLRVGCDREAYDACCLALKMSPGHEKARLRRAMASEGLGYHLDALEDCDALLAATGRDSVLGKQCLEVRRRVSKLASTKDSFVQPYQPGHLCNDEMTLRTYFSKPPPSAVPIGDFFTVSIYTANEFGLFDRNALQDLVHGKEVGFKALGSGVEIETRRREDLVLDRRGRASFQLKFVATGGDAVGTVASVSVGVIGGSLGGGIGVLDVASLHVKLLDGRGKASEFERGIGGAWCARPLLLEGIEEPLLIAECPDHGIPGKVWDGGLILAEAIARNCDWVKGKTVVEMGSGTGIVGTTACACGASQVTLTDLAEHVEVLRGTIHLNQHLVGESGRIRAVEHEWGSNADALLGQAEAFEVLLGSDIIYEPKSWSGLVDSLNRLSSTNSLVLIAHRKRHDDEHEFWTALGRTFDIEIVPFQSKVFPLVNDITIWRGTKREQEQTALATTAATATGTDGFWGGPPGPPVLG